MKRLRAGLFFVAGAAALWMAIHGINHVCHEPSEAAQKYIKEGCEGWHFLIHDAAGFFTAILAVITGFLAYYTYGLYRTTVGLAQDAEKNSAAQATHMQSFITAATATAQAATSQAKIAERTLTDLERPYVFIFSVGPMEQNEAGDWCVPYVIANYGRTPAIIESAVVGVVGTAESGIMLEPALLGDDSPISSAPFFAPHKELKVLEPIPGYLWVPGTTMDTVFDRPDDPTCEAKLYPHLANGVRGVFFRAVISYRGVFTSGHETACLWRYMGNGSFAARGIAPEHHYQR
jgi:hypothetical protein